MSTYMIVQARITDPERFKNYTAVVPALVARFGGQYVILAGQTEVLEGDWPQVKTVVSQWPDRSAAKAFGIRLNTVMRAACVKAPVNSPSF